MQDFRNLRVWRRAVALAVRCYEVTEAFPRDERYALTAQMRRSAVSVGSNIAEGCGRNSRGDFVRFLRIAYGSACELETQAAVAIETARCSEDDLRSLIEEIEQLRRMLSVFTGVVESGNEPHTG